MMLDGDLHRRVGFQCRRAVEAGVAAILRVDDAMEQPGEVARAFLRNCPAAFQHVAVPALFGQGPGSGTAGKAGPDDQRAPWVRWWRAAVHVCRQARRRASRREARCEAGSGDAGHAAQHIAARR